ncbi:MAG: lysophospholipase [Proteobacteria bacterium]|nr:lysophospholipase [Pseudomonadota bacterium]
MASYNHNMGVFLSSDRVRIFYQSWQVEHPKGILVISHGLGEHSGRYHNLLETLSGKDISIYASDHRGSGLSGGIRGHVDDFKKYYADIKHLVDAIIKNENKDIPIILLGHSLGGLIAELYALNYPEDLKALILSAPALIPTVEVPPWKKKLGKVFSNLFPTVTMSNEIDPNHISTDKSVVQAYLDDPLVHDQVSAKFYQEYLKATAEAIKRAKEIRMPILLIHGKSDKMVSIKSSQHIFREASSTDKTIEEFDGLFHETMNEKVEHREKVLKIMENWILKHI